VAGQVADHPAGTEALLRDELAGLGDVEGPEPAKLGVGQIDRLLVGREADAVGRVDVVALAADVAAINLRVVDRTELTPLRRRAAVVGEPEPALLVEDDVV